MTHSREGGSIITRGEVFILVLAFAALAILSALSHSRGTFSSVEVKFTDASAHGLAIVPASCPSNPHSSGQCGSSCTPSATCINSTTIKSVSSSCVVQTIACPTYWTCSAGGCVPPAGPSVKSFAARLPTGEVFTSTGHLEAHPTLVRSGNTTNLYWNVENVASCTVTSPNGDNFTCSGTTCSSGANGQTTTAIPRETTYTLSCTALPGATPTSLGETVKVTVVPTYQEQ